ncbi:hypothetical protein IJ22_18760 [Paenibacillus naphthalenovorans]|uniref:Uncharacterized protein n=2 Tax=Paenibacillus naphthalenovorans TaxID=162209 RepID=A0A0U2WA65_9BACL|nr:hypothetical protein IJ22_18760 [Paenibacillus naphthalenovorans]
MSYLFIGKGMFSEESLKEKLQQMGLRDPESILKEAKERKIAIRGRHKIMAVIA